MLINKYLTFKNIMSICITTIVIITMSDKINIDSNNNDTNKIRVLELRY